MIERAKAWVRMERELESARLQERAPDFGAIRPEKWVKVLDRLLERGQVDDVAHAIGDFVAYAPGLDWAESLGPLLSSLPPRDPQAPILSDEEGRDVVVAARDGADTLIFGFCGVRNRIGMPTPLFHRWLDSTRCSVVYLRDLQQKHFVKGVRSLGSDRAQTKAALRTLADDLGARRILCLGNSSGAYGAALYGLEIGAEAVLSFSGPTNLEPNFNTYLNRRDAALELREELPDEPLDLRAIHLAAPRRTRLHLVYGEYCWDDRLQAEHMDGVPGVELTALAGYQGHGCIPELARQGKLGPMLQRFVAAGAA